MLRFHDSSGRVHTSATLRVAVIGCGCIGAYVGGRLAIANTKDVHVTFLMSGSASNKRLAAAAQARGSVVLIDPDGIAKLVPCSSIESDKCLFDGAVHFTSDAAAALASVDVVLVATKRGANMSIRNTLQEHCPKATVLLFQNGLDAAEEYGPKSRAYQCIVTMNVVSDPSKAPGVFTRTSHWPKITVDACVEEACPGIVQRLSVAGFTVSAEPTQTFEAVQRGKLIMNMFNAPNALSGLSTVETLLDRRCLTLAALTAREALDCFKAAEQGVQPAIMSYVPGILSIFAHPFINCCIFFLLTIVAVVVSACRAISSRLRFTHDKHAVSLSEAHPWWSPLNVLDTSAHSSMWEDFRSGRPSEVSYLNGAVVALGEKYGIPTPANRAVVRAVLDVEKNYGSPPRIDSIEGRVDLIEDCIRAA